MYIFCFIFVILPLSFCLFGGAYCFINSIITYFRIRKFKKSMLNIFKDISRNYLDTEENN